MKIFTKRLAILKIILLSTLIISALSCNISSHPNEDLVEMFLHQVSERIKEKAISHINPAKKSIGLITKIMSSNVIKTKETTKLLKLFRDLLKINKQFFSIYYGDENGNFYQAKRKRDSDLIEFRIIRREAKKSHKEGDRFTNKIISYKWIRIDKQGNQWKEGPQKGTGNYDPRLRPWYDIAVRKKYLSWTSVYVFVRNQTLGLTVTTPVILSSRKNKANKIKGVVGIDIIVNPISEFLKSNKLLKNSKVKAFIMNPKMELVAYPANNIVTAKRVPKVITKKDFHDKILKKLSRNDREFIDRSYPLYRNEHRLKKGVTSDEKEKIRHILISIGFIKDNKKDEHEYRIKKIREFINDPEHGAIVGGYYILMVRLKRNRKKLSELTSEFFPYKYGGKGYYAYFSAFPKTFPQKWIVGVIIPEKDFKM